MSNEPPDPGACLQSGHPAWQPYREILRSLPAGAWRQPDLLNRILPAGVRTTGELAIRFADQASLIPLPYEQRIAASGIVSTRACNLHDLCNALVWARLPRCKAAFNALHVTEPRAGQPGRRGPRRDAVTLIDESGLLLLSDDRRLLGALREHDWRQAFQALRPSWIDRARMLLCGHAMLEKLLDPFKSMTAKALLIHVPEAVLRLPWSRIDGIVAEQLLTGAWLRQPRDLSALPVMGIPGWWTKSHQDDGFYADPDVFRRPGSGWVPAPLLAWPDPHA